MRIRDGYAGIFAVLFVGVFAFVNMVWARTVSVSNYAVPTPVISPPSGTILDVPLTVSMACSLEDAVIHYTTDGSEPSINSPVYARFEVNGGGKVTIKACAFNAQGMSSQVAKVEYAAGRCANPIISPRTGTVFVTSTREVSIQTGGEGVVRYTTDGSEPTETSTVYTGPFLITDTTTVKAKVFSSRYFDSEVVSANLIREWVAVSVPSIHAERNFTGSKTVVELTCSTPGATIHYTLDGQDPDPTSSVYERPFYIREGCVIKAYAVLDGCRDSLITTRTIRRAWSIGRTLGMPDHVFTTEGDAGFVRESDSTATQGESMKSGAIGDGGVSVLQTKMQGPGRLSFKWKTSCERDDGWHKRDHAEFLVDGREILRLDGMTDWLSVTHTVVGTNEHTIVWRYVKDETKKDGADCLWLADVGWASFYTETQTTRIPVPYAWLSANCDGVVDEYDSYERFAKQTAANPGYSVQDCYLAGLDPNDPAAEFQTLVSISNGIPQISWTPNLNETVEQRCYHVYGRVSLADANWAYHPQAGRHHFFKVGVSLPDGVTKTDRPGALACGDPPGNLYCVIDLTGGADATNYPVSFLSNIPKEGWTDEYKTSKLVLRRIEPGQFLMGSPSDEVGRCPDEDRHVVTVPREFWIGVFEVTQAQYERVTGWNPACYKGDMRPVECVSWDAISAPNGFLDRIGRKAGIFATLPTEEQWEYACRAETTTAFNSGRDLADASCDNAMNEVGRYGFNSGCYGGTKDGKGGFSANHTTVGCYRPNAWGLYDMHGNVWEWCQDGATSNSARAKRGGCWMDYAGCCRAAFRGGEDPSGTTACDGFRLCCPAKLFRED